MKKRKKNIERALILKSNIKKYHQFINLPQKNNILFNEDNIYYNPNTNKFQTS